MNTSSIAAIAAACAICLCAIAAAVGQGIAAKAAMDAIARQPEKAGEIRSTLIIAMALLEALAIYGLLIAFMLVAKV